MRIELAPELEKRFRGALRKAGRKEIGGMLMAEQMAPGSFRIVDFSLDLFSGSHTFFRRDPEAHLHMLNDFFERTGRNFARFNYLGEWHSHPSFSVHPSSEDMHSMREIVEDQGRGINFAVLLILRLRLWWRLEYSLTVFAQQQKPQSAILS
jgi:[CysO sulfur-carrier protein]-S-L-cysteine hydrolase